MATPWTHPEINDVRRWRKDGMTYEAIATAVQRTPKAVRHVCGRHGIRKGRGASLAGTSLAEELAAARAERDQAPPFKPGPLEW